MSPPDINKILTPAHLARGLFWTRAWSLVSGCTPVSPGCTHCWLRDMAHRFTGNYPEGICTPQGQWTGKIVTHPERLDIPLKTKKPQVWAIWSDLGHEDVPMEFRLKAFDRMEQAKQHLFLMVTKRPQIFLEFCMRYGIGDVNEWPKNIYLVVTAENQEQADIRLPIALQIPGARRIVLYEPALGPLTVAHFLIQDEFQNTGPDLCGDFQFSVDNFHAVIAGGETGPHARPAHPDLFRQVRDDCKGAGVPFFFKSWGESAPGSEYGKKMLVVYNDGRICEFTKEAILAEEKRSGINHQRANPSLMSRVGKKTAGRLLDGRTWEELPE